jgi:hypothetical protein
MNTTKEEIWQSLKNEKETIYGKKMLEVFLSVTTELEFNHFEEAINAGYDLNEELIRKNISNFPSKLFSTDPSIENSYYNKPSELLEKILKKENISSKLMRNIFEATYSVLGIEGIKEISKKINKNKITTDDVYILAWEFTNDIEEIYKIFEEKFKEFNAGMIIEILTEASYSDPPRWHGTSRAAKIEKIVNIFDGWDNVIQKMLNEIAISRIGSHRDRSLSFAIAQQWNNKLIKFTEMLKKFGLDDQIAEKIMEHKDKYKNAEEIANAIRDFGSSKSFHQILYSI